MVNQIINNLKEIKSLLKGLSQEQYNSKLTILSDAFIGQHVRHILEFYQCLFSAIENKAVDYDERKRDLKLETDNQFAVAVIDEIINTLTTIESDFPINFMANYSISEEDKPQAIKSTFYRELAFNLDHSIHHQALIKVGIKDLKLDHLIDDTFGYAPSTIRYLNRCVQ